MEAITGVLKLKPGRGKPVKNQHSWVFSGAIEFVEGAREPGDLVAVNDHRGHYLATGYFNPHSQIRARLLTWDPNQTIDQAHLFGRWVRESLDLGLPDADPRACEGLPRTAARIVPASLNPDPGPVHLNARFRKPLEVDTPDPPEVRRSRARVRAAISAGLPLPRRPSPQPSPQDLDRLAVRVRNRGIELAAHDTMAFLDDDSEPAPGWLDALRAAATEGGHGIMVEREEIAQREESSSLRKSQIEEGDLVSILEIPK